MSRLSPHVQALRAEAEALTKQADQLSPDTTFSHTLQAILLCMSSAKLDAANALEEWERQQAEGTHG